jgi:type IV secretion system protein VirB10
VTGGQDGDQSQRGIPQVGRSRKGNKWLLLLTTALAVVLMMALGVRSLLGGLRDRNAEKEPKATTATTLPDMTRDAFAVSQARRKEGGQPQAKAMPMPVSRDSKPGQISAEERAALDLAERRKRAPVLAGSSGGKRSTSSASVTPGGSSDGAAASSLGGALAATRAIGVQAALLADKSMAITQGMFLDCVLVTAINSQQPGMTSCVLSRNIYSTDGRVLLLERGSRIVGQYQSAQLRQGMSRIFVLWTRAETPNGVLVNLDSPGTDAVGRSGMDGKIDNHFWARFGSALLISVVDDVARYAANQNSSGGNSINFGGTAASTQDAASIIVQNTVNIPPTLDKAQGSHINIFVARDLDFSSVYSLVGKDGP